MEAESKGIYSVSTTIRDVRYIFVLERVHRSGIKDQCPETETGIGNGMRKSIPDTSLGPRVV